MINYSPQESIKRSNLRVFNSITNTEKNQKSSREKTIMLQKNSKSRISFWTREKHLYLALNNGEIKNLSRDPEQAVLRNGQLALVPDSIIGFKEERLTSESRSLFTVLCQDSLHLFCPHKKIIETSLQIREYITRKENPVECFVVFENRVLCVVTDQSRAVLLLLQKKKKEKGLKLAFLDVVPFQIKEIEGQKFSGR